MSSAADQNEQEKKQIVAENQENEKPEEKRLNKKKYNKKKKLKIVNRKFRPKNCKRRNS